MRYSRERPASLRKSRHWRYPISSNGDTKGKYPLVFLITTTPTHAAGPTRHLPARRVSKLWTPMRSDPDPPKPVKEPPGKREPPPPLQEPPPPEPEPSGPIKEPPAEKPRPIKAQASI